MLVHPLHYSLNKLMNLVLSCANAKTGPVLCTAYNTWSQKGHSGLHVLAVGT